MFSKRSVRILTVMMLIFYLFFYFYGLKTFGFYKRGDPLCFVFCRLSPAWTAADWKRC
mgnify:FL=1